MRRRVTAISVVLGFLAIGIRAQGRPDFSGDWVIVGAESVRIGNQPTEFQAPMGGRFVARQDDIGFRAARLSDPDATLVALFDGSETSRMTPTLQPGHFLESLTAAFWSDNRLVISTRANPANGRTDNSVLSLDQNGMLVWQWTPQRPELPGTATFTFKYRKR